MLEILTVRVQLTLGSHSCLLQTPAFWTGPASCPTRQMAEDTPYASAADSNSRSATYLDSPYPMGMGMVKSWIAFSGTFTPGCFADQLPTVEILDVSKIGGFLADWLERSMRSRTPAIWGSKDSRLRLKSTCHWLSLHRILATYHWRSKQMTYG